MSRIDVRKRLTPARIRNLERLATKLESLPKSYKHFDMSTFTSGSDQSDGVIRYMRHNGGVEQLGCGTVACAVGHGPSAGVLATASDFYVPSWSASPHVDWEAYSTKFIGPLRDDYDHVTDYCGSDSLWLFLFSGGWASIDNHHWGAAARIRYVLDHKALPEGYEADYEDDCDVMWGARSEYDSYRIARRQPLPDDFYPPSLLSKMVAAEGEKLVKQRA